MFYIAIRNEKEAAWKFVHKNEDTGAHYFGPFDKASGFLSVYDATTWFNSNRKPLNNTINSPDYDKSSLCVQKVQFRTKLMLR